MYIYSKVVKPWYFSGYKFWNLLLKCLLVIVQSVLNATAHLTAAARKFVHVTPLITTLHWPHGPERIQYKLCILVHRCFNGAAPQYLTELVRISRHRLHSASTAEVWCRPHVVQPSVATPSLSPVLEPGTVCLQICNSSGPFLFLNVI